MHGAKRTMKFVSPLATYTVANGDTNFSFDGIDSYHNECFEAVEAEDHVPSPRKLERLSEGDGRAPGSGT
jgi:hypothetical protein